MAVVGLGRKKGHVEYVEITSSRAALRRRSNSVGPSEKPPTLLQKTPCLLVEGRRRPTVNNNRGRFGISPTFEVRSASTPKGGVGRPRLSRHGLNERFFDSMAPSLPGTLGTVLVDLRPERCAMNADRIPHLLLKGREVILPLLAPHFPVTILRGGVVSVEMGAQGATH